MERVPGARAQNKEKARANATPEAKTVDPRVKVAKEKAREPAKGPAAVRVKDRERDKAVGGSLNKFSRQSNHRSTISYPHAHSGTGKIALRKILSGPQ